MKIKAFTSDLHLHHNNIIKYCNRPFTSIEEMHETYIKNYNEIIDKEDTVVWVGDCAFYKKSSNEEMINLISRFNGYKILVKGNHDPEPSKCLEWGFSLVTNEMYINIGDFKVKANHFPYYNSNSDKRYQNLRPKKENGVFLIHGHTHSPHKFQNNSIHVGIDAWQRPVLTSEIESIIKNDL